MNKPPIVLISCKVFSNFIEHFLPEGRVSQVTFLEYGLHRVPRNLQKNLQDNIDQIVKPSLIMLGYGLCGNGLCGISSGKHTLLIPRVDDCIAILLGSYQRYQQEFNSCPGTYYLSKGWLESGSNPLQEYHQYLEKYGEEKANWIMDTQYHRYKRLAFVSHRSEELDEFRPRAKEVAEYCQRWGMQYQEILGSEQYVRRLVEISVNLEKADQEFMVVHPGEIIKQSDFIRLL